MSDNVQEHTHVPVKIDEYKALKKQDEKVRQLEREVEILQGKNNIVNNVGVKIIEKLEQQNEQYCDAIKKALYELPNGYTNKAIMILHQALQEQE